jgi:hypothetical protein
MRSSKAELRVRGDKREPEKTHRRSIEMLIDDIGAQSFPASDPPAWGVVSSRLEEESRASRPRKGARGAL